MRGWWDTAQYVVPDAESLKRAEASAARELEAQSRVVRHARVEQTHRSFWDRVQAEQDRVRREREAQDWTVEQELRAMMREQEARIDAQRAQQEASGV